MQPDNGNIIHPIQSIRLLYRGALGFVIVALPAIGMLYGDREARSQQHGKEAWAGRIITEVVEGDPFDEPLESVVGRDLVRLTLDEAAVTGELNVSLNVESPGPKELLRVTKGYRQSVEEGRGWRLWTGRLEGMGLGLLADSIFIGLGALSLRGHRKSKAAENGATVT